MKGYKQQLKEYIVELRKERISPKNQRMCIREWKAGYWAAQESGEDRPYEDKEDPFLVTKGDFNPRETLKMKPRAHPKVTPYELDPEYREKREKEHGEADLKGVKQYPVTLQVEPIYPEPIFDHIKSARLKRSVQLLELKIGYDHKSNTHVLYSPLKYNERWDQQSQVLWLRVIGMSPKRISVKLNIKIDTIKNWLRALKGQPLVGATQYDWAIRQVDDKPEVSSKHSSIEAKLRKYTEGAI